MRVNSLQLNFNFIVWLLFGKRTVSQWVYKFKGRKDKQGQFGVCKTSSNGKPSEKQEHGSETQEGPMNRVEPRTISFWQQIQNEICCRQVTKTFTGECPHDQHLLLPTAVLQLRLELTTSQPTHKLLPYKYHALTDCATGACTGAISVAQQACFERQYLCEEQMHWKLNLS